MVEEYPVNKKTVKIIIVALLAVFIWRGFFWDAKYTNVRYEKPVWMDNEHIMCVKYISHVTEHKGWISGWFYSVSKGVFETTKEEIQIVSMKDNGTEEKVLRNIVIDYKNGSPRSREEIFKGVYFIRSLAYNPYKNMIAFGCDGAKNPIFIFKLKEEKIEKIVDMGTNPSWSPDGELLLFSILVDDKGLWVYSLEKNNKYKIADDVTIGEWHPIENSVIYTLVNEVTGGQIVSDTFIYNLRENLKLKIPYARNISWSLDYSKIKYTATIPLYGTKEKYKYEFNIIWVEKNRIMDKITIDGVIGGIWGRDSNSIIYSNNEEFFEYDLYLKEKKYLFECSCADRQQSFRVRSYPMRYMKGSRLLIRDSCENLCIYNLNDFNKEKEKKIEEFSVISYSPDNGKILANSKDGLSVINVENLGYKVTLGEGKYVN